MNTIITEAEKRHETQLRFLREGYSQDEARSMAATMPVDKLDEWLEMTKDSLRHPERQIVPPGTIDLEDVKRQREYALMDAEEEKYFEKREQLTALMVQSFSVFELPLAGVVALLDALEANDVDRMTAMADVIKTVEHLQLCLSHQKKEVIYCPS